MRETRISIFVIVLILIAFGIVMIYSASAIYADSCAGDSLYYIKRHLVYLALGIIMMLAAMSVDMESLKRLAKPALFTALILLVLVLVPHVGKEISGAKRWFKLGLVNFQPSEFAKLAIIIYIADFAARKGDAMKNFFFGYLPALMALGMTAGLVLLEPDLGTAVTISVITLIMLYVGGVRPIHIWAFFLASIPALYVLLFRVPYRRKRMMIFLNPWADKQGIS